MQRIWNDKKYLFHGRHKRQNLHKSTTLHIKPFLLFARPRNLRDFIRNLKSEGSFARNYTIAFSGNTTSILIGFLFTPFIARIYTPEAYGFFAFFISISQNIAIISTLQLPRAFVLPETEAEFHRVLYSALLAMVFIVGSSAVILLLLGDSIFRFFNVGPAQMPLLIYVIPVSILLYASNDILKSWNVRGKRFTRNALNQVLSSTVSRGTTMVYGLATSGNIWGLLFGDIISKVLEFFFLGGRVFRRTSLQLLSFREIQFFQTLKDYRSYPLFMLPGVWVQALITQLPVYAALFFFDSDSAGYYSFANSLLNLPVYVLAGAMAPVFLQKASETFRRDPSDMGRLVESLANRLFFTGLLPIVFLIVFGDYLFILILGDQWLNSGRMASYMGVYFLFMIINYPLVSLYRIYKKEHLSLFINLMVLVLAASGLAIGHMYHDFMIGIAFFSGASLIGYISNISVILKLSGIPPLRIIFRWAMFFLGVGVICFLFRRLIEDVWL
jgi:O-antigen/teichoic acid export membrane protein